MDGPPLAGSTARALQAKGLETERTSAIPRRAGAGASGVIMGAFGSGNETELEALFSEAAW